MLRPGSRSATQPTSNAGTEHSMIIVSEGVMSPASDGKNLHSEVPNLIVFDVIISNQIGKHCT